MRPTIRAMSFWMALVGLIVVFVCDARNYAALSSIGGADFGYFGCVYAISRGWLSADQGGDRGDS